MTAVARIGFGLATCRRLRINRGIVEVDPQPLPPGTPATITIS
jgi:hypothetical protein